MNTRPSRISRLLGEYLGLFRRHWVNRLGRELIAGIP
jgi:hypothetical protein